QPKVEDLDSTIDKLLEGKYSIVRFGDGELKLMYGESIKFQDSSDELGQRLRNIISENADRLLIGVPDVFTSLKQYGRNSRIYWMKDLARTRNKWLALLSDKYTYYNSFITRPYMIYKNKSNSEAIFAKLKLIWNDRDVVII